MKLLRNLIFQWKRNKCTGEDWFTAFLKKNRKLSIRVPELTSLQRATNVKQANVTIFFDKLANILIFERR